MGGGKKGCYQCGRKVPTAKKVCDCGFMFLTTKKCYKCGLVVHITKKICECNFVFKERKPSKFVELPVELTSERLRPSRPIRMKRPLYNNEDFIYNVSLELADDNDSSIHSNLLYGNKNSIPNNDLKSNALESAAEAIVTNSKSSLSGKEKGKPFEKLYPKRERSKITKYELGANSPKWSGDKKNNTEGKVLSDRDIDNDILVEPCNASIGGNIRNDESCEIKVKRTTSYSPVFNRDTHFSHIERVDKAEKFLNKKIVLNDDNLKDSIRAEISEAMKKKVWHNNQMRNSMHSKLKQPGISSELSNSGNKGDQKSYEDVGGKGLDVKTEEENVCAGKISVIDVNLENGKKCVNGNKRFNRKSIDEISNMLKKRSNEGNIIYAQPLLEGTEVMSAKGFDITLGGHSKTKQKKRPPKIGKNGLITRPVGRPRKHPINITQLYRKGNVCAGKLVNEKSTFVDETQQCIVEEGNFDPLTESSKVNTNKELWSPRIENASKKRGRPLGCKDSKPRKIRFDYIERLMARKKDVSSLNKADSSPSKMEDERSYCLTSSSSLMNDILDPDEIERLEKKGNTFCIPEHKKELYSLILDELNRRIVSQSFQLSL